MGDLSNAVFDYPLLSIGVVILAVLAIWFLLRHRPPSPFIKGGKNRKPRLFVVDAAAVDARRRIVLIRRDNVEHLVMIGGPNDLLLETRIPAPIGTRHQRPEIPATETAPQDGGNTRN